MPRIVGFVRDQYTSLPIPEPTADIKDATYIVTGANTGLGFECAKHLFRLGAKRIILSARSRSKGEAALAEIRRETGRPDAGEVWDLDLTSLDSVEAFAQRVGALDRLDGLIENAGVVMTKFTQVHGLEQTLFVNVVATMLLAFRALPKLQEQARKLQKKTNLVIVSSNTGLEAEREKTMASLSGDIFDALSKDDRFNALVQYPTTKLLEIYTVRQLAALYPVSESGVIITAVNPGLCYSELDRNAPALGRMAMAVMRKVLARSTEVGSRNLVHAALVGPECHGAYFSECREKNHYIPEWVSNESGQRMQKRVWDDLLKRLGSLGHGVDVQAV